MTWLISIGIALGVIVGMIVIIYLVDRLCVVIGSDTMFGILFFGSMIVLLVIGIHNNLFGKWGKEMRIDTYRVKQYNSTSKTVVCIDGIPICIVQGCGKTLSNIISYIQGYDVKINDGRIKKLLDKYKVNKEG